MPSSKRNAKRARRGNRSSVPADIGEAPPQNHHLSPEERAEIASLKKGRVAPSSRNPYLNNMVRFILWLEQRHPHLLTEHVPRAGNSSGKMLAQVKRRIKAILSEVLYTNYLLRIEFTLCTG